MPVAGIPPCGDVMTPKFRRLFTRIVPVTAIAGALVATAAIAPSAVASVRRDSAAAAAVDYSKLVADHKEASTSPGDLGGWSYTEGLFLWGTYLIYKRTGDK